MANAPSEDSEVGYDLYRQSGFALSRADLNDRLADEGRKPVSQRTFRHFRALQRAGYDRYVSINRFDVDPYKAADRSAMIININAPVINSTVMAGQSITSQRIDATLT